MVTVGASESRNHFGCYMERAAAGEEIAVSGRREPTVRLIASQARLARAAEQPVREPIRRRQASLFPSPKIG